MKKKYPILYDQSSITFGQLHSNREKLYLFDKIFNRQFKEDILEWYDACPRGSNIWYGAFHNDLPVGMYALLPMQFKIKNQLYDGALCNNVGVVPEFQGKGLFQALGEYALQDSNFPIVIGVPNSQSVKGHKRIGWKSYGVLELLHRKAEVAFISNYNTEKVAFFPPKRNYDFLVNKDLDWMKWRYSRPGYEYKQSIFPNNRHIIWKNYEQKKQVLETNDVDLVFDLGGEVDIWQFAGSSKSEYLKSKGFIPIFKNEFIIYLNQEIDLEFNINSIKFELADNDVF